MLTNQNIDWQGEMLGRYRMIRLLGRGGMGEVWLAEDTELRRQIAAKLLPSVLASDESYLHAFEYEARTAAALEHPHILPIHDFGEQHIADDEVVTYLITPYMAGGSLRDRLRASTHVLPPHESLSYLKQAAQAIDYAHSQNVLHRDIKPANMLLQEGWLFLADFGLAKLLSSETQRTRTHTGSGTPEYMAPEQARGHATSASDRYSLAMTAYQLLTGALPFRGDSPYEVLIKQIKTAPLAPTQWNPTLPLEVEEILLRGLAKQPEDRLPTCVAFVNALEQAFAPLQQTALDDAEITLPAPWNKRLRKIVLTSPLQQPLTPTFTTQDASLSQTPTQPSLSSQASLQATSNQVREQTVTPPSHIGYPVTPTPLVEPKQNTYSPTLHYPPVQDSPTRQEETPPPQEPKRKIGRRELVIGGGTAATLAVAGGASFLIWQRTSSPSAPPAKALPGPQKLMPGVPLLNIARHLRTVYNAAWDPTGRYLATAGEDQTVMLWDVGSYLAKSPKQVQTLTKPLRRWRLPGTIYSNGLSWSYDGRYLVATPVAGANQIFLLDVFGKTDDPIIYKDSSKTDDIGGPDFLYNAWSPTTSTFAAAISNTQNVLLWQLKQPNTPIKTLYNDQGPRKIDGVAISVGDLAWSADGTMLATITNNFNLAIWDVKTGKVKYYINVPDAPLTLPPGTNAIFVIRDALQWSPVDNRLILASNANIVNVWDVQQSKKPRWQLGTNDKDALTPPPNNDAGMGFKWNPNITGVSWSPNGRYLAGGYGRSHKINIWDLQEKKPVVSKGIQMPNLLFGQYNGHGDTVTDTRWSPNGRYIATSSFDTTVIVWKVDEA